MPEGAADRWGSKASKHFCCKDICLPQLARERPELLDVLRARLVAARDAKVEAADLRGAVPARRVARLQHERNATGHRAAARSEMQARVATMQAGGERARERRVRPQGWRRRRAPPRTQCPDRIPSAFHRGPATSRVPCRPRSWAGTCFCMCSPRSPL